MAKLKRQNCHIFKKSKKVKSRELGYQLSPIKLLALAMGIQRRLLSVGCLSLTNMTYMFGSSAAESFLLQLLTF